MQHYPPAAGMQVGGGFTRNANKRDTDTLAPSNDLPGNLLLIPDFVEHKIEANQTKTNITRQSDWKSYWKIVFRRTFLFLLHAGAWLATMSIPSAMYQNNKPSIEKASASAQSNVTTTSLGSAAETCFDGTKVSIANIQLAVAILSGLIILFVVLHSFLRYKNAAVSLFDTEKNPLMWLFDMLILAFGMFVVLGSGIIYTSALVGVYACGKDDFDTAAASWSFTAFLCSIFAFAQLLTYWSVWLKTDA